MIVTTKQFDYNKILLYGVQKNEYVTLLYYFGYITRFQPCHVSGQNPCQQDFRKGAPFHPKSATI